MISHTACLVLLETTVPIALERIKLSNVKVDFSVSGNLLQKKSSALKDTTALQENGPKNAPQARTAPRAERLPMRSALQGITV